MRFELNFIRIFLPMLFISALLKAQKPEFEHLTVENGLSQSSVLSIAQDKLGFMWFGTRDGLNKYDSRDCEIFKHVPEDTTSLSSSKDIYALLCDHEGNIWVGTKNGLNLYLPKSNSFRHFLHTRAPNSISSNVIKCIYEDREGHLWIGTDNGLNKLNPDFTFQSFFQGPNPENSLINNHIKVVFEDKERNIWVGTTTGLCRMNYYNKRYEFKNFKHSNADQHTIVNDDITAISEDHHGNLWIGTNNGFCQLNKSTYSFTNFVHEEAKTNTLANNFIRQIFVNEDGNLWLATKGGINIYNANDGTFKLLDNDPNDSKSLSQNSIYKIYKDRDGTIWIGTFFGGVNLLNSNNLPFEILSNRQSRSRLSCNVVSAMVEDKKHGLWIGTEAEGLNYLDRQTGNVRFYKDETGSKGHSTLSSVKALSIDNKGDVWVGTHEGGLSKFDILTDKFLKYKSDPSDPLDLKPRNVSALLHDASRRFWVGTEGGGLYLFDNDQGKFRSLYKSSVNLQLKRKEITFLFEDSGHNVWVASAEGLFLLKNKSLKFQTVIASEKLQVVNVVAEDSKRRIWIGTYDQGLLCLDKGNKIISKFTVTEGLPSNNILGILEDNQGALWVSTDNGLSSFNGSTFRYYSTKDGLPGNVFNANSFLKDHDGTLFFGGYNGLVSFNPHSIKDNKISPNVVITGLKLFNRTIRPGDGSKLLKESMIYTKELNFSYQQNVFSIDFAVLNYIKSVKNAYAFKLKGFQKDWTYTNTPQATFTNLPPGVYCLLIKGANNDGVWSVNPAQLIINIEPPLWKKWWAYCLYCTAFICILIAIIRYLFMRERLKRANELHQMKLDFFTNVSHEIRTPLTLIMGPLESVIKQTEDHINLNRQLLGIRNNTDRLFRLINELLDFRKAESNGLKLYVAQADIVSFVKEIYRSFDYLAIQHNIKFEFLTDQNHYPICFDKEQLEKVIYNLLSNAFKFTPDAGHISVTIREEDQFIFIEVKDTGIGVSLENRKNLFKNFYQIHNAGYRRGVGTGIGLAFSKKIARLHHGDVFFKENENMSGSCFVVKLLKGKEHFTKEQFLINDLKDDDIFNYKNNSLPLIGQTDDKDEISREYTILVVEDNYELRDFIIQSLSVRYFTIAAENGNEGIDIAVNRIPDLIISDIMMPQTDGLELCSKLKTDYRTSHIPIILLTARSGHIHQVNGLKTGADMFITKPFNIELLLLNISNLLFLSDKLRKKFSQQMVLEPRNIPIESKDQEFLEKAIRVIEKNFDNSNFGVNDLASEVNMSTPILYKKIKSLTDMSVNNFIKSLRLKRAAQLLKQGKYTINEISYLVGFSGSKYFSKEFFKYFGISPSEYKEHDH